MSGPTRRPRPLEVGLAVWRLGLAEALAYRASLLVWVLTTTFPLVSLALWSAVAADAPIAGYGQLEFTRYFVAAFLVRQLTSSWVVWDLERQIRTGELNALLLRPYSPIVHHAMLNLAALPVRALLAAPLAIAVLALTPGAWAGAPTSTLAAAALALGLAWVIQFTSQLCIASLAFWITSSASLYELWLAGYLVLSGYLVPTELMPGFLEPLARWLPFWATLGFPVELLASPVEGVGAWAGLATQAVWAALLAAAAAAMWRAGLRRHGAEGT